MGALLVNSTLASWIPDRVHQLSGNAFNDCTPKHVGFTAIAYGQFYYDTKIVLIAVVARTGAVSNCYLQR